MIIFGAAKIPLRVGDRSVDSEILITPDLNGLIIGIDWLEKQGQFVWNFRDGRIKFDENKWIELQKEEPSRRIRKVYVSEDTFIPPNKNVEANVRITHQTVEDIPFVGIIRQCEFPVCEDIVWTQFFLPAKFADVRIPLLNLGEEGRLVPRGTYLGRLYEAEVLSIPEENGFLPDRKIRVPDPNELARKDNPMIHWTRQRRDRMRELMEQYEADVRLLDLDHEIVLTKLKEFEGSKSMNWCIDCRQLPKFLNDEIPAIHHLTNPPEEER